MKSNTTNKDGSTTQNEGKENISSSIPANEIDGQMVLAVEANIASAIQDQQAEIGTNNPLMEPNAVIILPNKEEIPPNETITVPIDG